MKKTISLVICLLLLTISSCGKKNDDMKFDEQKLKEDYLIYANSGGEKHLKIDEIHILKYYGRYSNSFIVKMGRGAYQVMTFIIFPDLGIRMDFGDSNTPLVYSDGKFYELFDAYSNGVITKENVMELK